MEDQYVFFPKLNFWFPLSLSTPAVIMLRSSNVASFMKLPLALLGRVRCSPPHIALGDFVISAFSQAPVFLLNVSSSEPGLDTVVSIVVSLSTVPSHVWWWIFPVCLTANEWMNEMIWLHDLNTLTPSHHLLLRKSGSQVERVQMCHGR